MNTQRNRSDWLRLIRFCFRGTFVLFGLAALNMIPGIANPDGGYFVYSTYLLGTAILVFAAVVNVYPVLFLGDLHRAQEKKRFRFGVFFL